MSGKRDPIQLNLNTKSLVSNAIVETIVIVRDFYRSAEHDSKHMI